MENPIQSMAPWFHNIHLPDGTQTAPHHIYGDFPAWKWEQVASFIPQDLTGKKALDVGCNGGFYTLELAKRGAQVLAIDLDPHYLKQAEWVVQQFSLQDRVSFRHQQVYDLARDNEVYDLVWFMGVFYHLRYPLLALDILSSKVKELLIFQTMTMPGKAPGENFYEGKSHLSMDDRMEFLHESWPKMAFIEHYLGQDATVWWAPNISCVQAMLRSCGMSILAYPGHEIVISAPQKNGEEIHHPLKGWNSSEYLSATGRDWQEKLEKKLQKWKKV